MSSDMASSTSSASTPPPPTPEVYYCKPNAHCPNSPLPVLVYRNVLPATRPLTEAAVREAIEPNHWKHGGTFKHYPSAHFHSVFNPARAHLPAKQMLMERQNTHECYAALAGRTRCLYGVGPLDDGAEGVVFEMQAGDVAVHAAGVSHRNVESWDGYEYMGLYPEGAPKWNNNFCKAGAEETRSKVRELLSANSVNVGPPSNERFEWYLDDGPDFCQQAEEARHIPVPEYDPIYGLDGPLPRLWRKAAGSP